LDQRSNEGRSPNEEKTFTARQSLASHRGGKAAPKSRRQSRAQITSAKPRPNHVGKAAPKSRRQSRAQVTSAKPRPGDVGKAAPKSRRQSRAQVTSAKPRTHHGGMVPDASFFR